MPIWKARPRPEDADTAAKAEGAGSDAAPTAEPAVVETLEAGTAETAGAATASAAAIAIDETSDPFVPDPSFTGVAASPEAYAAARAALAAKLIGARYGDSADDYLEHVRLAVHAMNDDVTDTEKAVQVVPPTRTTILVPLPVSMLKTPAVAPPPQPVVQQVVQPVVQPVVRAEDEEPRRRRRPVAFILAGGLLVVLAAGIAGYETLAPKPTPTADPTTGPTGSQLPLVVVGTHATLSPTPTAAPTKAPTRAPTKKPVVKKATPVPFYARWSPNPPKYPNWRVQTWAGASCTLTRIWMAPAPSPTTTRTYTMTVDASGVGTYTSGAWATSRTYHVYATCKLNGKTASTTTYTLNL